MQLLTHHVNEEEQRFLPELVSVLGPEESTRLAERFNARKHKVRVRGAGIRGEMAALTCSTSLTP